MLFPFYQSEKAGYFKENEVLVYTTVRDFAEHYYIQWKIKKVMYLLS